MADKTIEKIALERFQRVTENQIIEAKEKKAKEIESLFALELERLAHQADINKLNEAVEQQRLDQAKPTEKSDVVVLKAELPIEPVFRDSFVQQANGTIVDDVNYRYSKPKDEAAKIATTAGMTDTLTEMKRNTIKYLELDHVHASDTPLKLNSADLHGLDLDEKSVVYHDDHMSAALKDGTKFTHRNHSKSDTSTIEYHLPEKHKDDIFAQALRIGNISALLAAINHQKPEYGRWHQTGPVMVQAVPKVIDQHVSLYALAKSIEIFQLGHMGYKMVNPMQQELTFEHVKQNTQNLMDFVHQNKLGLSFNQ